MDVRRVQRVNAHPIHRVVAIKAALTRSTRAHTTTRKLSPMAGVTVPDSQFTNAHSVASLHLLGLADGFQLLPALPSLT